MKLVTLLLAGFSCAVGHQTFAAEQPRGSVLELHSCELYAGGCIVSSEATLGGRYMLRAWNFNGGSYHGTDLAGLSIAALQSSTDNLAQSKASPGQVIVYLPAQATAPQRAALLSWIKSSQLGHGTKNDIQTRTLQVQFSTTDSGYALTAGQFVSVKTAPLESCSTGACGEALWYAPRAQTSVFTVAVDRSSQIHEPLLQLTWDDAGRRSVFLGKFGQDTSAKNLYVSSSELCSAKSSLF